MSENEDKVEKAKNQIVREMENDERYKSFFAPYRVNSVKRFIASYASNKARLEVYGNVKQDTEQRIMEEWQKVAWECLEEIQHKKLFDLSCQWYAGLVKNLPEIDISLHFRIIGYRILDYKGISSISEEDLDFYLRYINEEKSALGYYHHWDEYQDYSDVKKHYKKHKKTGILYYDYQNQQSGNDRFLNLKAIKRKKESDYYQIAQAKRMKNAPKIVVKESKPNLNNYETELVVFAREFKDLKTANYIESILEMRRNKPKFHTQWAIDYLDQISDEDVSVNANENWLDGIYEAAVEHRRGKIKEMLPSIYEEYLMKISAGIKFTLQDANNHFQHFEERFKKNVLDGRELSGAPRDFDY